MLLLLVVVDVILAVAVDVVVVVVVVDVVVDVVVAVVAEGCLFSGFNGHTLTLPQDALRRREVN